jgi:hypothetical protein
MSASGGTSHQDVAAIMGAPALVIAGVGFTTTLILRWTSRRGYSLGNVAYPTGKDAADPG